MWSERTRWSTGNCVILHTVRPVYFAAVLSICQSSQVMLHCSLTAAGTELAQSGRSWGGQWRGKNLQKETHRNYLWAARQWAVFAPRLMKISGFFAYWNIIWWWELGLCLFVVSHTIILGCCEGIMPFFGSQTIKDILKQLIQNAVISFSKAKSGQVDMTKIIFKVERFVWWTWLPGR